MKLFTENVSNSTFLNSQNTKKKELPVAALLCYPVNERGPQLR
jgi:hypothetical protein